MILSAIDLNHFKYSLLLCNLSLFAKYGFQVKMCEAPQVYSLTAPCKWKKRCYFTLKITKNFLFMDDWQENDIVVYFALNFRDEKFVTAVRV